MCVTRARALAGCASHTAHGQADGAGGVGRDLEKERSILAGGGTFLGAGGGGGAVDLRESSRESCCSRTGSRARRRDGAAGGADRGEGCGG